MHMDSYNGEMSDSRDDFEMHKFREAQEPKNPADIEELQQATEHAHTVVEGALSRSVYDDSRQSVAFEHWVDVSDQLEEIFLENEEGALGKRLIELLALDDDPFNTHLVEARALVEQTSAMASQVYSLIHRLVLDKFGSDREDVVRKLEIADILRSENLHGVTIVPRRRTIIGLLRDMDSRIGTKIWSLEYPPEISGKIIILDPFSTDATVAAYWRDRVLAGHALDSKIRPDVFSISQDTTHKLMYELSVIGGETIDVELKVATEIIISWLSDREFYYQDPDPRDFEYYHLGAEDPHHMMEIIRALDVLKEKDPELFIEMIGINPEDGGRSPYFGSFLQKALFNTQRVVDSGDSELGEMAITTMLAQLMDIDGKVIPYAGVVSREALREMTNQMKAKIQEEETPEDKTSLATMFLVPYLPMAVDAAVREQLERLREVNIESVRKELVRHLEDRNHPLKIAEYIGSMHLGAFDDPSVGKMLRGAIKIEEDLDLPWEEPGKLREMFREKNPKAMFPLYDRIPLMDESRADLGYGLLAQVVVRDALALEGFAAGFITGLNIMNPGENKGMDSMIKYLKYREVTPEFIISLRQQVGVINHYYIELAIERFNRLPAISRIQVLSG